MIAFVFPGQGAQKVGMGKALAEAFPICRQTFDEADAALGESLSRLCFEGPESQLLLTENTQPAILAVSVAACRLAVSHGVTAAFAAGHSLGEYSAHVAAGTLSFADALRTVRRRGQFMQEAVPVGEGAMSAILGADADTVGAGVRRGARGACGPGRFAGQPERAGAGRHRRARGRRRARRRAGQGRRRQARDSARRERPLPLRAHEARRGSSRAASPRAAERRTRGFPSSPTSTPSRRRRPPPPSMRLIRQVSSPVRWEDVVKRLVAEGARTFVELGPGNVLAGLVKKIDRSVTVASVEDPAGLEALLKRIGHSCQSC